MVEGLAGLFEHPVGYIDLTGDVVQQSVGVMFGRGGNVAGQLRVDASTQYGPHVDQSNQGRVRSDRRSGRPQLN